MEFTRVTAAAAVGARSHTIAFPAGARWRTHHSVVASVFVIT